MTVDVSALNDGPAFDGNDLYGAGLEDGAPVTGNPTATDPDGDTLTWAVGTPNNGTVTIDPTTGMWSYVGEPNWFGSDFFTISIDDGNGVTTYETVYVDIFPTNDEPTITGGLTGTGPEDAPVTGTATATDIDGDTLSWDIFTNPSNGVVTINAVTGEWSYLPDADFNGTDTFEVTADDGNGGTTTATVNVTVTPTNDAPVITGGTTPTGDEDEPVNGTLIGSDSEDDTLTYTFDTDPTNGTVVVNPDGTYTYTQDPDFNGTDTFEVTVDDGNGGTTTATVTVTVTPVNDAPVITGGITGTSDGTATTGQLTGDDVDGDTLTYTLVTGPSNGTVTVHPDGTWTYTPDTGFNATDTFVVQVADGNGGVDTDTVTVTTTRAIRDVRVTSFLDVNGNGVRDNGEPLTGTNLTLAPSWGGAGRGGTGPDALFDDVIVGTWTADATSTGLTSTPTTFTFTGGADEVPVSVALAGTAGARVTAGWDDNGDGVADRFITNAVITVTWAGADGVRLTADDIVFEVTTDSSGRWSSATMPAGSYTLGYAATTTMMELSAGTTTDANIVLSAPPTSTTPTAPTTPPVAPVVPSAPTGDLPATGGSPATPITAAVGLLMLGLLATGAGRRRRL